MLEQRWGRNFPHPSRPALYSGYRIFFQGVKRGLRDVKQLSLSGAKVEDVSSPLDLHGVSQGALYLLTSALYLPLALGYAVAQLVEALRYKAEGRGFDSR